jgi:hypothetical protein
MSRHFNAAAAVLTLCLGSAVPGLSAPAGFTTDKASPLKLANPRHGRVTHFAGIVQLSGRFLVAWQRGNHDLRGLRVAFFPDRDSAVLLPHASEGGPVKELVFPNAGQAAALLLDKDTAHRIFAKEQVSAAGEATVTIHDYRTAVACDHRWYMADLISVARAALVADAGVAGPPEC